MTTTQTEASLPTVGARGSYCVGTDHYPVTVVAVSKSGHRVTARVAKRTVISGAEWEGPVRYAFEADPEGEFVTFTRRANGHYVVAGWASSGRLRLAGWYAYHDRSL